MDPIENATCSRIADILSKEMLAVHFQPIVCLKNQTIYGYEGLIRGPVNTILQPPTMLFDTATQCGLRAQLDLLCRKMVIKQFARLNLPGHLFINVDPVSFLHENFHAGRTLEHVEKMGLESSNVIIELTETHPIDDIQLLRTCMAHYRSMGFRVALDDLGAGYSGLKLWSESKPDIVKVDRHFIQGIDGR